MMSKSTKQNLLLALLLTIIVFGGIYLTQVTRYNKLVGSGPIVESQQVTVTGQITCLPHKDTSGPVTLECAFGMKDAEGTHYGLNDPDMLTTPYLSSGAPITVTGVLSPDPDSRYDIVGVIEVESVTQ